MHPQPLVTAFAALLPYVSAKTSGALCAGSASEAEGNWYCKEVKKIIFHNISSTGQYLRTTNMDIPNGICSHEQVSYSGVSPESPLFGEVCAFHETRLPIK